MVSICQTFCSGPPHIPSPVLLRGVCVQVPDDPSYNCDHRWDYIYLSAPITFLQLAQVRVRPLASTTYNLPVITILDAEVSDIWPFGSHRYARSKLLNAPPGTHFMITKGPHGPPPCTEVMPAYNGHSQLHTHFFSAVGCDFELSHPAVRNCVHRRTCCCCCSKCRNPSWDAKVMREVKLDHFFSLRTPSRLWWRVLILSIYSVQSDYQIKT